MASETLAGLSQLASMLQFQPPTFQAVLAASCAICSTTLIWNYNKKPDLVRYSQLLSYKLSIATLIAANSILTANLLPELAHSSAASRMASLSSFTAVCMVPLLYLLHKRKLEPSLLLAACIAGSIACDVIQSWACLFNISSHALCLGTLATNMLLKAFLLGLEEIPKTSHIVHKELRESLPALYAYGVFHRFLFPWLNSAVLFGFSTSAAVQSMNALSHDVLSKNISEKLARSDAVDNEDSWELLSFPCIQKILSAATAVLLPRILLLTLTLAQPLYISHIVTFLNESSVSNPDVYSQQYKDKLFGAALLVYAGVAILRAVYAQSIRRFVTILRGMIASRICIKTFALFHTEAQQIAAIALLNVNIEGIAEASQQCFDALVSPFELGLCLYMLNLMVGPASFLIVIPTLVSTFLGWCMGAQIPSSNKTWSEASSMRISKTSAMLDQLHEIRLNGLYRVFSNTIQKRHDQELRRGIHSRRWMIALMMTRAFCESMSTPIVFGGSLFWTAMAGKLSAQQAFASFAIMRLAGDPLKQMIEAYSNIMTVIGHYRQIESFLMQKDVHDERTKHGELSTSATGAAIEFIDATFAIQGTNTTIIRQCTIDVQPAALLMVVGSVASGKSSFIRSIIRETALQEGSRYVRTGPIAYCDQTPWLCDVSIRDNVIGPSRLDEQWYDIVLEACDLQHDIQRLVLGDATLVGNRGSNLSLGQKHKVCLARAVYSRHDIIVLDDIFSALDRDTAVRVFSRLFGTSGLLRQSHITTVMATLSKEFLRQADQILVIETGGTSSVQQYSDDATFQLHLDELGCRFDAFARVPEQASAAVINNQATGVGDPTGQTEASSSTATKGWRLHLFYWSTFPRKALSMFFIGTLFAAFTEIAPIAVVRIWLETDLTNVNFLKSYMTLWLLTCFWMLACLSLWFLYLVPASARNIHQMALSTLKRCTLAFMSTMRCDSTLSLFSQDITALSRSLAIHAMRILYIICIFSFTVVMATPSAWYSCMALPLTLCVFYTLQRCYLRISREVERHEKTSNAQLQSQLVQIASGLQHIRSFKWETSSLQMTLDILDISQRPFYFKMSLQAWLRLMIDLTHVLPIAASVWYALYRGLTGSQTGMALVMLMTLSEKGVEIVHHSTVLETSLLSVARLKRFITETPLETEPEKTDVVIPKEADKFGRVMLHDVAAWHASQAQAPPVVMASFSIPPGSKVGIEGETGIGKTSFFLTLLNFLEYRGRITIDHTDIQKIPREVLRSSVITTLSPEVIEFEESVRYNLCPWTMDISPGEGNPHDIGPVEILQELGLWDIVASHGGLDARMSELGLSHGQKQLFCIARACLQKLSTGSRLVLMDDVTSGLDDDAVKAARDVMDIAFDDCTVFMVSNNPQHLENCNYMLRFNDGVMKIRSREPANKTPAPSLPPNFVNPPTGMGSQPGMEHLLAFITNGERLAQQQIAEMKRRGAL